MWDHPAFIGSIAAIPAIILGYLGYRSSVSKDEIAQQSNIATTQIGAVGQVIDGLNKLVASLQDDNKTLRLDIVDLRGKYKELSDKCDLLDRELDTLKRGR